MEQGLLFAIVIFPLVLYALGARNYPVYSGLIPFLGGGTALIGTVLVALSGAPITARWLQTGLQLDTLSGSISFAVLTIGGVVMRYSARYLEDDPKREHFLKSIAFVLVSVMIMLLTSNLAALIVAWAAASFFLHRLLMHFSERVKARRAAEQKFWVSRFGDLFLVAGAFGLHQIFGTMDLPEMFTMAAQLPSDHPNLFTLNASLCLLTAGAIVKSAQYPFHFWLPKSLETPTPISALLHAGVINGGGYLVIRLSPILHQSDVALIMLLLFGTLSTVYGALVMSVQSDVKKQLAFSTVAQMGFMMVQCGLGAYQLASLHIVGHAFYKSYAFLSSGRAADLGKIRKLSPRRGALTTDNLWPQVIAMTMAVLGFLAILWITGINPLGKSGGILLSLVLVLAMAQALLSSENKTIGVTFALLMGISYFVLSHFWGHLLEGVVQMRVTQHSLGHSIIAGFSLLAFFGLYVGQNNLHRFFETKFGCKFYVYLLNGGYLGR